MSPSVHSQPLQQHHQQQPSVDHSQPPSEPAQKQLQQYLDSLIDRLAPTQLLTIGISDTDGYLIASSTMPTTTATAATDQPTKLKQQRLSTPPQQPLPLQVLYTHLHQIPLACQQASKLSLGNATIITLNYQHYTLVVYNLTPIYVTFVVDYKPTSSSSDAAGSSKGKNGSSSAYSSNLGLLHSIYGSVSGSLQSLRTSIQSQRDAAV